MVIPTEKNTANGASTGIDGGGYLTAAISRAICRQNGYLTLAICGVSDAQHGEESTSGYLAPAVLKAHMWEKWQPRPPPACIVIACMRGYPCTPYPK